jgi:hypothetical protein
MNPAFHYVVRAKLIRFNKDNKIDFSEFEEKFENEEPIFAREEAFNHYQSYIDVLLESKNKKYTSDRNAREELKSFYEPDSDFKMTFGGQEVDFKNNVGFGVGVFMVIDEPLPSGFPDLTEFGIILPSHKELYIHGIGNIGSYFSNDGHMCNLWEELEYYNYYKYKKENKEIEILYCCEETWNVEPMSEYEPAPSRFLETPFDWEGYDKPYWWGEPEAEQIPKTIEEIIASGESNQVEFKPALLYNFSTGRAGIGIKGIIAKTICAFLNSKGGYLFIGVSDDGKIQGLDYDYKLAGDKNVRDFFRLEFDQMLEHFLSFSVKNNVEGDFYEVENKEIFVVAVSPNVRRPIFLKGQNGKEFYVRGEASSRLLIDIEEIVNYCIDRFSNQ